MKRGRSGSRDNARVTIDSSDSNLCCETQPELSKAGMLLRRGIAGMRCPLSSTTSMAWMQQPPPTYLDDSIDHIYGFCFCFLFLTLLSEVNKTQHETGEIRLRPMLEVVIPL